MTQGLAPLLDAKGGVLPASGTSTPAPDVSPQTWADTAPVEIEGGHAPDATRIPVKLKSGEIGTLPLADLGDPSVERVISPAEYREHVETGKKEKGFFDPTIAHALGFARGISGGATDIAAKGVAGTFFGNEAERETARYLREEKAAHPYISGEGELGGFVAGALLPGVGEASAATKAETLSPEIESGLAAMRGEGTTSGLMQALSVVGEAPKAVGRAGGLIEQQTAKLLGGGAAAKIAGTTLGGAAEGALYSADAQLDEQVLGDQDLNGEKIASAAGYGALVGGALAGTTATFTTLAKKGLAASSPTLQKLAGEQAFRAASPTKGIVERAAKKGISAAEIGQEMLDQDVIPSEGSALERALTPEELSPRNQSAMKRIVGEMGEITGASPAEVSLTDVTATYDKAIGKLRENTWDAEFADTLEKKRDALVSKYAGNDLNPEVAVNIQDLIKERRALGAQAFTAPKNTPLGKVMRQMYGDISDLETQALDAASEGVGGAEGQKLKALNKSYQKLKFAQDALDKSAAGMVSGRALGPSDYGTGIGAAIGVAAGHAAPVAAAGGFLTSLAHKFIRQRGNSLAASYLDRLSQLGALRNVIAGVDSDTEKAVASFMGGKRGVPHETLSMPPYRGGALKRRFQDAVEDASQPPKSIDFTHAPGIGTAVRSTLLRTTAFLQTKIPEPTVDRYSLTPQLEKKQYTPQDMQSFLRYYEAARHPGLLAHELAQGKVHPETVEAVQTVAPKLYAELQQKVMAAASSLKNPLSYDQKIQLGVLFNQPTHWSLDPNFLRAFQATKAPAPGPAPGGGKGGGKPRGHRSAKPLSVTPYATSVDAVQMGGASRLR